MDDGLTPKEIADELGTKSVQSVRHRMEAIQKERDAIRTYKTRQRMKEKEVYSVNRVGLFPYVADELSIKALKHLLPLYSTGLSIVNTGTGYVILIDPETYLPSVWNDFISLEIYGRLCSKKDRSGQIRVMSNPSSHKELSWGEMIRSPFMVISPDDDEKLQAFLYPYLEKGKIISMELNTITLKADKNQEYNLKSMQLDADKSPLHVHIEYSPLTKTALGFVPVKLNENDLELISRKTLNNLDTLVLNEFLKYADQLETLHALCKTSRLSGNNNGEILQEIVRLIPQITAQSEKVLNCEVGSRENIQVFMTPEIRQKIEEEIHKNAGYVNERVDRAYSYVYDYYKKVRM